MDINSFDPGEDDIAVEDNPTEHMDEQSSSSDRNDCENDSDWEDIASSSTACKSKRNPLLKCVIHNNKI